MLKENSNYNCKYANMMLGRDDVVDLFLSNNEGKICNLIKLRIMVVYIDSNHCFLSHSLILQKFQFEVIVVHLLTIKLLVLLNVRLE